MDLQAKKLELVQLILNTNQPQLLEKISELLKQEQRNDWWDELPVAAQQAIETGIEEDDHGETSSHNNIIKEARKKYGL